MTGSLGVSSDFDYRVENILCTHKYTNMWGSISNMITDIWNHMRNATATCIKSKNLDHMVVFTENRRWMIPETHSLAWKGKISIAGICITSASFHTVWYIYLAPWFWARIQNYRLKVQMVGSQILRLNPPWINDFAQWLFSDFFLLFGIDLCAEVVGGV